jgi:aspartate oxidase
LELEGKGGCGKQYELALEVAKLGMEKGANNLNSNSLTRCIMLAL